MPPVRTAPSLLLAVGLAVALAGCGDDRSPAQQPTAAKQRSRPVCGYAVSGADRIPAEVAQLLPGRPALLNSEAMADGGSRVEALVGLPFKQAFDAIISRTEANGWSIQDRERETSDAEV